MYVIVLLGIIMITVGTLSAVWAPAAGYHRVDPDTGVCLDCGHDTTGGR